MKISVRLAVVDDAPKIARAHVRSWQAAYRGLMPEEVLEGLSVDRRTNQWSQWLAPGGERALTLVGLRDGEIAGFATLVVPTRDAEEPDDVGEIPALYVDPAAWGSGVGRALMEASLEELREAGCREVILWMLEGNERGADFYERGGWRRDGGRRQTRNYPEDIERVEVRYRLAI